MCAQRPELLVADLYLRGYQRGGALGATCVETYSAFVCPQTKGEPGQLFSTFARVPANWPVGLGLESTWQRPNHRIATRTHRAKCKGPR
jgi:hypothetical protein